MSDHPNAPGNDDTPPVTEEPTSQGMPLRSNGSNGVTQRQDFGGSEITRAAETASSAVAARARAEVEARYVMAMHRPRDLDECRVRLMKHTRRRGFAEAARYSKPIGGKKIEGASIRFVETALQEYGNVLPETTVVYDDDEKRILRVSVSDLERNVTYSEDAIVPKTVERKKLRRGQRAISQRTNSYGDVVYLVHATDDDLAVKQGAEVSKKIRNLGLRILPADLVDEAMGRCVHTIRQNIEEDPDAERKRLADAFAAMGVSPKNLAEYLGHELGQTTPGELVELRAVFEALRDGEATWSDALDVKREERGEDPPDKPRASKGARAVRERLEKRRNKEPAKEQPMDDQEPADVLEGLEAEIAMAKDVGALEALRPAIKKQSAKERKRLEKLLADRLGELPASEDAELLDGLLEYRERGAEENT